LYLLSVAILAVIASKYQMHESTNDAPEEDNHYKHLDDGEGKQ